MTGGRFPTGIRPTRTGCRPGRVLVLGAATLSVLLSTAGRQPAADKDRDRAVAIARALVIPQTPGATGLPFLWRRIRSMDFDEFRELRDELIDLTPFEDLDSAARWMGVHPQDVPWEQVVANLEPAGGDHVGLAVAFLLTVKGRVAACKVSMGRVALADDLSRDQGDDPDWHMERVVDWDMQFGAHGEAYVPLEVFAILDGRLVRTATTLRFHFTPDPEEEAELKQLKQRLASPRADVREATLRSFAIEGAHRLEPVVLQLAERDPDPSVRIAAVEALQTIGTFDSLPRLAALVADPVVATTAGDTLVQLTDYRNSIGTWVKPHAMSAAQWQAWIAPRAVELRRRLSGTR